MARFCSGCGAVLKTQSKFCPTCGLALAMQAGQSVSASRRSGLLSSRRQGWNSRLVGASVAGGLLATALAGAWFGGLLGSNWQKKTLVADAAAGSADADAPRPANWFAAYSDKFLSGDLVVYVTGTAQKRDFPTSKGSTILATVQPGERLTGQWVEGADPATKWLKIPDRGYIWEGNLAGEAVITSSGMLGMSAGMPHVSISARLNEAGTDSINSFECSIFPSRDGRVSVMLLQDKSGSFSTVDDALHTREGIHVGSSEANLLSTYGSRLAREENPYDGVDYYYWDTPDRGIKFSVSGGVVKGITSGDRSIKYVEGSS